MADIEIEVIALLDDGISTSVTAHTDETGYFANVRALPPGNYPQLIIRTHAEDVDAEFQTIQPDIEVFRDSVVDLGTLPLQQATEN